MNCIFWLDGYCIHNQAPKSDLSCIGKESCDAWKDDHKSYSVDNYKAIKELIKARAN